MQQHPENVIGKWISIFKIEKSYNDSPFAKQPEQCPFSGHPCRVIDISGRSLMARLYYYNEYGKHKFRIITIDLDYFTYEFLTNTYVLNWFSQYKKMFRQFNMFFPETAMLLQLKSDT